MLNLTFLRKLADFKDPNVKVKIEHLIFESGRANIRRLVCWSQISAWTSGLNHLRWSEYYLRMNIQIFDLIKKPIKSTIFFKFSLKSTIVWVPMFHWDEETMQWSLVILLTQCWYNWWPWIIMTFSSSELHNCPFLSIWGRFIHKWLNIQISEGGKGLWIFGILKGPNEYSKIRIFGPPLSQS